MADIDDADLVMLDGHPFSPGDHRIGWPPVGDVHESGMGDPGAGAAPGFSRVAGRCQRFTVSGTVSTVTGRPSSGETKYAVRRPGPLRVAL